LLILLLSISKGLMAQPPQQQGKKMTPEQHGTLKAKALRLHLDLSTTQEEQIKKILVTHMASVKGQLEKGKSEKLSQFDRKLHLMEFQLALQEEMKSILTEKQYENWKKAKSQKKRMAMHHRGRDGRKYTMKKEGPYRYRR
jgi:hypothetical protein